MTIQELNNIIRLNTELERDREMLESIQAKAYSPSAPNMSGMPHGSGINQKTEKFAVEITDLSNEIEKLQNQIAAAQKEIEMYCSHVTDTKVRMALRMRFVHFMTWKEVAGMLGKYYTTESVKTMCYNYIKGRSPKISSDADSEQLCLWNTEE